LLPYAAKLLPVLSGIAIPESSRHSADLSSLDRRFGEIQIESRGLRSQVTSQGDAIERILKIHQEGLERLGIGIENLRGAQQDLATESHALARWLKGLSFAILLVLIAVVVLSALILFRMSHV
jgi:hypothetical protein